METNQYILVSDAAELFDKSDSMLRTLKRRGEVDSQINEEGYLELSYPDLVKCYGDPHQKAAPVTPISDSSSGDFGLMLGSFERDKKRLEDEKELLRSERDEWRQKYEDLLAKKEADIQIIRDDFERRIEDKDKLLAERFSREDSKQNESNILLLETVRALKDSQERVAQLEAQNEPEPAPQVTPQQPRSLWQKLTGS